MRTISLIFGLFLSSTTILASDFSSYAFVEDDSTLRIGHQTVRLYGIIIPVFDQGCASTVHPVECGPREAVLALKSKVGSNFVHCDIKEHKPDGSVLATCTANASHLHRQRPGSGRLAHPARLGHCRAQRPTRIRRTGKDCPPARHRNVGHSTGWLAGALSSTLPSISLPVRRPLALHRPAGLPAITHRHRPHAVREASRSFRPWAKAGSSNSPGFRCSAWIRESAVGPRSPRLRR